jgi:hypothetical protein
MPACRNHPDRPDGRLPTQASAQARRPSRSIIPFPYMPRVADLPPGWRHFTAGQKIEHLISLDRCCHEILSWEPITELDSVRLSFQMQVMRILLRIGLKAVLDAGSLRLLPTRPKQPGASKGATTSSPRPRTRSSNPVPSSSESIANPISLSLAAPYLACYTHRVAISNSRLVSLDKRGVTFRYKDYRRDGPHPAIV